MRYDFRVCKCCGETGGRPKYRLRNATTVYVCSVCGFHYIDYLDDLQSLRTTAADFGSKKHKLFEYIENVLHHSRERYESKVRLLATHVPLDGVRCLDVGAGGGLFLHLLRERGAEVHGIEPEPGYADFAAARYGLVLRPETIEEPHWQDGHRKFFDIVTLWDVVEHVNYPVQTLRGAIAVLKPSGLLCVDTPIRDCFFHRAGVFTYRLSGGRYPSFLNMEYSRQTFGHKQIFATQELCRLVTRLGCKVEMWKKMHELSFPYDVYLRKAVRSPAAARLLSPFAAVFFALFRIRNKIVLIARRES